MRGGLSAPRWTVLLAMVLVAAGHLACAIPSLVTRSRPTPTVRPTRPPTPTAVAIAPTTPGASFTARISEDEVNRMLESQQPTLGEGVDCSDMHARIRPDAITLTATLKMAQLRSALVPVEIRLKPVAREHRMQIEVLDVRLGGPYAMMSGVVRPLLAAGLSEALGGQGLIGGQGMRVSSVELQDGYMVITAVPAS